jgi:hypothetical protein
MIMDIMITLKYAPFSSLQNSMIILAVWKNFELTGTLQTNGSTLCSQTLNTNTFFILTCLEDIAGTVFHTSGSPASTIDLLGRVKP